LNSADATYILITSASTLYQQTTFPTPQQRREYIFLGKVVHPNRSTITSINQTVDFDVSPMAALRDLWTPLKLINQGIVVSYYSAGTMNIQTSSGTLWGNGIGWTTSQLNPDSISISGTSPTTFQYRSRLGPITGSTGLPAAPTGNTTTIDSHHYDLNGSIVAVGGNNRATNQRIYLFPTGLIRIQYGQFSYSTMANAIAGIDTEIFVEYGNNRDNGILIGILTVREDASDLSSTGDAQFRFVSKFGELFGGTGGISTTTLQQAYDNSTTPEIVINSTLDGVTIKNGTGNADNVTNLLEGQNAAGTTTSFIRADGAFSGTSIFGTGLSATTVSATTYFNLPVSAVTNGTGISASTNNGIVTITNTSPNQTVTITGGTNIQIVSSYPNFGVNFTGGTILKYFVTGSTPSGIINDGDRWFNTNDGVELVRITDGDGSQWIQPNNGGSNSGSTSSPSITGTGTSNTITKWLDSSGLTDSIITDDGTTVTVNGKQKITGNLTYETSLSTYGASGEFFYFGGGSTTISQTYYYNSSGNWSVTDATSSTSSTGLISISAGSTPSGDGMLSKGYYVLDYGSFTTGDKLYISSSNPGQLTNTAPTTSGHIVRVVGYVINGGSSLIYFCPDNTWIELV
jgi:hypothetical protein